MSVLWGARTVCCYNVTTRLQYTGCGVVEGVRSLDEGFRAPNGSDRAGAWLAFDISTFWVVSTSSLIVF